MPNTLVKTQPFFKIPPCLQQRILFKFNQTLLDWNFMDYIIPDLSMAYNITFHESVMKQNLNWSHWFDREQEFWSPQGIVCATLTLVLPCAMPALKLLDLNQLCPAAGSVEDCALSDLPDNVEFVTFSSGDYGEYSHLDRLNMVRITLVEIEVQNAKACVLLNFACICKFEHTDRESGAEKAQIAVGIVTNQHLPNNR